MGAAPGEQTAAATPPRVHSFPAAVLADATVLILGSMPGVASLAAGQYYAHPRNQLWPILGALCGAPDGLDYATRLRWVQQRGIAIWDVLSSCERRGSLDAQVRVGSAVANDVPGLVRQHPQLRCIALNGQLAAGLLQRHFGSVLEQIEPALCIRALPSTSPANARWNRAARSAVWSEALGPYLRGVERGA